MGGAANCNAGTADAAADSIANCVANNSVANWAGVTSGQPLSPTIGHNSGVAAPPNCVANSVAGDPPTCRCHHRGALVCVPVRQDAWNYARKIATSFCVSNPACIDGS